MAFVKQRTQESFESLCKRFKRKVFNEGIIKECKKYTRYLKPSEKRKIAAQNRMKKIRKYQQKEDRNEKDTKVSTKRR